MDEHAPIDERQLDRESGRLLQAYTAEYRLAKRYRALHLGVSALLALAGPLSSIWSQDAAGVVGAGAGLWVLLSRLVVVPAERRRVHSAVRMQERFDVRLFELPWPSSLAGAEPSEEDISDAARRMSGDERLRHQHEDGWYPSTRGLPWPVDVLIAQWGSVAYGRRQQRAYFQFLVVAVSTASAATVVYGVATSMSLTDWLIVFLLPSLPALLDMSELADTHRRTASARAALETRIDDMWRTELLEPGRTALDDVRSVQDDLFRIRSAGVNVPEWFYWVTRDRNEANMHDAAAARRARYDSSSGGHGSRPG